MATDAAKPSMFSGKAKKKKKKKANNKHDSIKIKRKHIHKG